MKPKLCCLVSLLLLVLLCGSNSLTVAQAQKSTPTTSTAKRGEGGYRVQLQLLVASNLASAKNDYPSTLEAIVKQVKSSLSFKSHYLVANYFYNVADGSSLEVNDVSYQPFEGGSGINPTLLKIGIAGIRLNENNSSVHISRFKFESRKRMFLGNVAVEGSSTPKPLSDYVETGISTELNVSEGVPTVVGTTTSGLSDAVLVLVLTVNQAEMR